MFSISNSLGTSLFGSHPDALRSATTPLSSSLTNCGKTPVFRGSELQLRHKAHGYKKPLAPEVAPVASFPQTFKSLRLGFCQRGTRVLRSTQFNPQLF